MEKKTESGYWDDPRVTESNQDPCDTWIRLLTTFWGRVDRHLLEAITASLNPTGGLWLGYVSRK